MFPDFFPKKMTAWVLIFMQLCMPVTGMVPLLTHAAAPSEAQVTVQGLNALIMGDPGEVSSPSPEHTSGFNEKAKIPYSAPLSLPDAKPEAGLPLSSGWDISRLPDLSPPADKSAGAQPHKAGSEAPKADPDADASAYLASGATQAGTLLSSDNATDASINYAKGVGEGLINQQINDWLKQFGNAKVSLGSDKKVSGDMLIPLYDTERDLLFTQVGVRTGQERNTANLGFGYRQYLSDWMLGVNTFYDYDYTGKNKRLGAGAEAWRDYLKLAVNGYYRLTDWHQSVLSAMKDYDERPANGFDLRAEGYLPAWPNLGGTLKYEQYFGKGVSLSNSASVDSLKNNPKALTAGVTYTPFPLMTLSAARSVGDINDTRLGLDLNYRLGVPWYRQVSPDSVDLMRSLAGSKYDFVDRNYEIVMQYRKQELLTISLPAATTAQAAETVPVVLTVSKAKYGLKSVNWNVDATLTARGGRYRQVSPTELRVTLPAYVFGQQTNAAQNYKISAVATDNNGNQSNITETLIGVMPSENTVSSLIVSPNDRVLPANDSDSYTITGVVTDGKGAPLANQSVTFSISGLANAAGRSGATLSASDDKIMNSEKITATTLADGKATILLRSRVAGQATVTATMDNGNSGSGKVSFVADATTAAVTALIAEDDNAIADGKATNSVAITVKDKFGNPVNGAEVYLTASNGAKIADKVSTNEQGGATVTLTNTKAGPLTVAASLNGSQKEVTVTFGVGKPALDATEIKTDKSDYTTGDDITVSAVLKDEKHNAVTGRQALLTDSAVTVPGAFAKSGSKWVEDAQTPGVYTRRYVAKTASVNQSASLSLAGWSKTSKAYSITANIYTAAVVSLEVKDNNAVADGNAKNSVWITVEDNYGNRVKGAVVSVEASNGALITDSETTDQEGMVLISLTNVKAGVSTVVASLNSSSKSINISFGVGQPVKANSHITTDKTTYISGSDIHVQITLADQKQNAVAGLNSEKLNSMVEVANAEAKSTTNWVESSTAGSYIGTYVARNSGENLTSTLKVSDGNKTSDPYTITAGKVVLANSGITRDSGSYVSGTDIKVTVTLKDGNSTSNPVTGLSSDTLAGMVTVANAEAKPASSWAEVVGTPGTYVGTYVAKTAGTGLKATLSIAGSSKTSEAYAITAGSPVQARSAVSVDNTIYAAGDDITVTAVLKDGQGNAVSGQAGALTSGTTTLGNATLKPASTWTEGGTKGTYTIVYTANTVSTGNVASVKLSGWGAAASSSAYAITQGGVVEAGAKVETDAASYVAGTEMAVTVTLKDGQSNGATGQKASLTDAAVTVANATAKAAGGWVDNGNGTYSRTYIANTVGSGLKATLRLSGWGAAASSSAYAITQGGVVEAGAKVETDAASYVAGTEMAVTVTLKDGQGNGATGQKASLTDAAVTVANATAKAAGGWVDNGDGTYSRTYIANTVGSGLKATLRLSGWGAAAASSAYAITQGGVVEAGAKVETDAASYVAGTEMAVTVTLKDGQGNGATGQKASLTDAAVTVANATAKAAGGWVDNGDGTYSRTYIANTVGSGLKATLRLSGWGAAAASSAYAITQGGVVEAGAKVETDAASYVAGTEMAVTVTLKDGQGNGATGQKASLTDAAVTVANATAKAAGGWADNGDGTYSRTYIANTVGSGLKATLRLSGWGAAAASSAYAITQGGVVEAGAKVETDAASYVAGTEMAVTVTLKDGQGNGATGQKASLTDAAVTVANATAKAAGGWADNGDGTYSRTYIANTVGSGLKATLRLSGWGAAAASSAYAITQGGVVEAGAKVETDAASYVAGTEMAVTVTLKDGQGNGATGQKASLTDAAVMVANATAKAAGGWVDNGDGTYSRTYIANTVGSGLKATLRLSGWGAAAASSAYAITQGGVVEAGAKVETDAASYVAGTEMAVTVTLKDGQGNGATGQKASLTDAAVTVANATAKAAGGWADNGDGTYSRTYIANTVGSGLKATLRLSGWGAAAESDAYSVTSGMAAVLTLNIITNNSTANGSSKNVVKAIVRDSENNPVPGSQVDFQSMSNLVINVINSVTNDDGEVTANLSANVSGSYDINAKVSGTDLESLTNVYFTLNPDSAVVESESYQDEAAVISSDLCKTGRDITSLPETNQVGFNYAIALSQKNSSGEVVYASGSPEDEISYSVEVKMISGNQRDLLVALDTGIGRNNLLVASITVGRTAASYVQTKRVWKPRFCSSTPVKFIARPKVYVKGERILEMTPKDGLILEIK